jgi:hypothetical protein
MDRINTWWLTIQLCTVPVPDAGTQAASRHWQASQMARGGRRSVPQPRHFCTSSSCRLTASHQGAESRSGMGLGRRERFTCPPARSAPTWPRVCSRAAPWTAPPRRRAPAAPALPQSCATASAMWLMPWTKPSDMNPPCVLTGMVPPIRVAPVRHRRGIPRGIGVASRVALAWHPVLASPVAPASHRCGIGAASAWHPELHRCGIGVASVPRLDTGTSRLLSSKQALGKEDW